MFDSSQSYPAITGRTSRCSYRVSGAGPLLVFISGLDGTGELFFKQEPPLCRSYRVVTFRHRDSGDFDYEDLADDVAEIIRELGEQRATVIGESFGGGVAMTFALRYPEVLERLVIVNSFPRYREQAKIKLTAWLFSKIPFRILRPARIVANKIGLSVDRVSRQDRNRFFEVVSTIHPEGYARRLHLISQFNIEDRLSEIHAPTLLIATERDLLVKSIREARFMAERIPNATVKILRGVGHAFQLGGRYYLADLINEWKSDTERNREVYLAGS
jgi:pimeloyl-ACP methyl ester carboxylesterase